MIKALKTGVKYVHNRQNNQICSCPYPIITDLLLGNGFFWLLERPLSQKFSGVLQHPPDPPPLRHIACGNVQGAYGDLPTCLWDVQKCSSFPYLTLFFFLE